MRITRRPAIAGVPGLEEAAGVSTSAASVPAPSEAAGERPPTDKVDLSEAARFRQRLRTEVGDLNGVAVDRVGALRSQVVAGRFQPAPRAIAERLLADLAIDLLA